ncbi:hypothetical protein IF1G_07641 [Cordyceps javanica]|uniref:Uncharacterized protein n=1 Tax=Cordyceps javanica TaxID=43265 RepID=A0A545UWS1_9HYPO|nr:hypothetical protein IF1G_07641 [Cordyceps javanica]
MQHCSSIWSPHSCQRMAPPQSFCDRLQPFLYLLYGLHRYSFASSASLPSLQICNLTTYARPPANDLIIRRVCIHVRSSAIALLFGHAGDPSAPNMGNASATFRPVT